MKKLLPILSIFILFTNLIFATNIISWKNTYSIDENVWIELQDKPGNDEDWIGIYPAGSSTDWGNVVQWRWAKDTSQTEEDPGDWYKFNDLPAGEYEARFFLNNSFDIEKKVNFSIGEKSTNILSWKNTYSIDENVWIELQDKPGNDEDWIGIYPAGSSTDWGNVVQWRWAKDTSQTEEDPGDWYKFNDLPAGEYEVRFFLNNSFEVEDYTTFSILNNNGEQYGIFGEYQDRVEKYPYGDTTIYYVPNKTNSPVVMFLTGYNTDILQYDQLLEFIASHGYYVIPLKESGDFENPSNYAEKFENILKVAIDNDNVDASKIGVIGHSSGGGDAFYIMDYFKNHNRKYQNITYASNADFVISLDGWFAFGMNATQMANLNTTSLIMQFGGADGVDHMQNPKINLSIYHMLRNDERAFSFIDAKEDDGSENHMYLTGNVANKPSASDLLGPIHALLDYKFKGNNEAYTFALKDQHDSIIVHDEENYYEYGCKYNDNYNYCDPDSFK